MYILLGFVRLFVISLKSYNLKIHLFLKGPNISYCDSVPEAQNWWIFTTELESSPDQLNELVCLPRFASDDV